MNTMKAIRWLACVWGASLMLILAFNAVMVEPYSFTSWRPWVGWLMVWTACEVYNLREAKG